MSDLLLMVNGFVVFIFPRKLASLMLCCLIWNKNHIKVIVCVCVSEVEFQFGIVCMGRLLQN